MNTPKRVVIRSGSRGRKVIVELFGNDKSGSFTYLVDARRVVAISVTDGSGNLSLDNQTSLRIVPER